MHLTRQTDFALRTMIYLAALQPGARVHIRQICDAFDISPNHLTKVVNKLANLGYIDSRRGRGGGVRLGRPAAEVNIGELVKVMEPSLNPVNCFDPPCALLPGCRFKGALARASDAFLETLSAYSLADFADASPELVRIVSDPPP